MTIENRHRCEPQVFRVSKVDWGAMFSLIQMNGFSLDSDADELEGKASNDEFGIEYTYDPESGSLSITCVDRKLWDSCDVINEKIRAMVNNMLG